MDAILLTWRWQNILSIWIMVIALGLVVTFGSQAIRRANGSTGAAT